MTGYINSAIKMSKEKKWIYVWLAPDMLV
jgi:hypothetical protein